MPRAKKLPGQAVDSRNGQRDAVRAAPMAKFALPKRDRGWLPETQKAWRALWADGSLSAVLLPVDRPVLLRWADALDRAQRHLELGDLNPIATGSQGQEVQSPHYVIAQDALKIAQAMESQLGVGALNRARLGIAVLAEQRSLMDLSAGYPGDDAGAPDAARYADPR